MTGGTDQRGEKSKTAEKDTEAPARPPKTAAESQYSNMMASGLMSSGAGLGATRTGNLSFLETEAFRLTKPASVMGFMEGEQPDKQTEDSASATTEDYRKANFEKIKKDAPFTNLSENKEEVLMERLTSASENQNKDMKGLLAAVTEMLPMHGLDDLSESKAGTLQAYKGRLQALLPQLISNAQKMADISGDEAYNRYIVEAVRQQDNSISWINIYFERMDNEMPEPERPKHYVPELPPLHEATEEVTRRLRTEHWAHDTADRRETRYP